MVKADKRYRSRQVERYVWAFDMHLIVTHSKSLGQCCVDFVRNHLGDGVRLRKY